MELAIRNITKRYGKIKALESFSAVLTPGIYGLLGPNGAGKSTLMNILACNLRADGGQAVFNGQEILSMGMGYRAILGYMPQQQGLYDGMSGLRFMHYMAALKGMDKKSARNEIPETLEKVGLYGERHKMLHAYSGGMKQRILIAQAILNDPHIIIMDEPTASLDPKQRISVRNLISQISINKIVLIATHVVSDIAYIAKEVMLLNNGILLRRDTIPALNEIVSGKVFATQTDEHGFEVLKGRYKISNVSKNSDSLSVRFISDEVPQGIACETVDASLEDVYLYLFDDDPGF